jgi:hypothetical protein
LQQAAKMNTTETGLENSILLLNPGEHLDCITKQRAKGPTGRRLPRQAKSRLYPASDAVQQQQRSESLPRLEPAVNNDPVNIRLGNVKHAAIIPGNRLINRMMELDSVDEDESTVVVEPDPPPPVPILKIPDDDKLAVPDHSGFDQSWFLGSARASSGGPTILSPPPQTELIGGAGGAGAEQSDAQSSSSTSLPTGVTSRPANRYWTCNFL